MTKKLFKLGKIVFTQGVATAFDDALESPTDYLLRHIQGDWGNLCEGDKEINNNAVKDGSRILSAYELSDNTAIWIITEGDRAITTFLLPSEY